MMIKFSLAFSAAFSLVFAAPSAQASDPFAFQFGYTLGYQNSFRNRLPTPPYFAIHPPVYYGQRYARPYGESPFAAFSQLRSSADYYAVPKDTPFRTRSVVNSHVEHAMPQQPVSEPVAQAIKEPGRTVVIINPFAQEQVAKGN